MYLNDSRYLDFQRLTFYITFNRIKYFYTPKVVIIFCAKARQKKMHKKSQHFIAQNRDNTSSSESFSPLTQKLIQDNY